MSFKKTDFPETADMKRRMIYSALYCVIIFFICAIVSIPYLSARQETVFSGPASAGSVFLDKGIYAVQVAYTSGNYAYISIRPQDADDGIRCGLIYLLPERQSETCRLYVDKNGITANWTANHAYADSDLHLHKVRFLYLPLTTAVYVILRNAFPFLCVLAIAWVSFYLIKCSRADRYLMIGLFLLTVLLCLPLFGNGVILGHDNRFHMHRIVEIGRHGMKPGNMPLRLFSGWFNDYGYPLGVFYGNVLLWIPSVLYRFGLPMWKCLRFLLIAVIAANVTVSYLCFHAITGDRRTGFFGSTLYSCSVWFLTGVYTRCAVGEISATVFLPVIALALCSYMRDLPRKGTILLIAGYTGLVQTHVLTTVTTTVFVACFCLAEHKIFLRGKTLKYLVCAACSALLLNAGFLVPFLDYMKRYDLVGQHYNPDGIQKYGIALSQLFSWDYNVHGLPGFDGQPAWEQMAQTPGVALLLSVCIVPVALSVAKERRNRGTVLVLSLLAAVSVFMTTRYFPWDAMMKYIPPLYAVLGKNIQFQSRYHLLSSVLLTLLAALSCGSLMRAGRKRTCTFVMCALSVVALGQAIHFQTAFMRADRNVSLFDASNFDGYMDNLYVRMGASVSNVKDATVYPSGDAVQTENIARDQQHFALDVENTSQTEGWLDFPVWNYAGYVAESGDGQKLSVSDGAELRVRVAIPPGFRDRLVLRFSEPWYWRVAEAVSMLALCLYVYMCAGLRNCLASKSVDLQ